MTTKVPLSTADLEGCSYPDFVGMIGQQNTPPGGHATIFEWIDAGGMGKDSYALDLACSTGFSGREVHAETKARIHGIDISAPAIEAARGFGADSERLTYQVADATALPIPDGVFSHVLAGCNFGFIQEREKALDEVVRVLSTGGVLCVSSFYYRETPPAEITERVEASIGFLPVIDHDYEFWKSFFLTKFDAIYERRVDLAPKSSRIVAQQVRRSIKNSPALRGISRETRIAATQRLLTIRQTLNEHRRYQGLSVAAWKLRA